jgi:hypothetical protein
MEIRDCGGLRVRREESMILCASKCDPSTHPSQRMKASLFLNLNLQSQHWLTLTFQDLTRAYVGIYLKSALINSFTILTYNELDLSLPACLPAGIN